MIQILNFNQDSKVYFYLITLCHKKYTYDEHKNISGVIGSSKVEYPIPRGYTNSSKKKELKKTNRR